MIPFSGPRNWVGQPACGCFWAAYKNFSKSTESLSLHWSLKSSSHRSLRSSSHRSLRSSSHRSLSWITSLPPVSQIWRVCIVFVSVAQLEWRLCPSFILASVAQLEYLPPVSQSVRAPLSSLRSCVGRSVGVPPSRQSVWQGASVSSSHWSLSWSTSLVCQGAPLSSLRPRVGRSVGVPPSCQSVLVSSSHRLLSWSTSLPSLSLSRCLCIILAPVAQLEYLPRPSGRLCPRFVLASVAQLEYVPHVQVHVRVYAYICVNIVYIFTLSFHTSLPSIPSISQSVSGPSWHAREADRTQVRNHRRPVPYTQGATAPCRC